MTTIKCSQCKRELNKDVYYYNEKMHKTCFSCAERRKYKKNFCRVCGIRAGYNYEGETVGVCCRDHKDVEMVDIKHKKCIKCNIKIPVFNVEGETRAFYCGDCRTPEMVDVKNKKCIVCKKKLSTFNFEGKLDTTHCRDCRTPEMVNVKDKKCIVCNIKIPVFNIEGSSKAFYCGDCRTSEMVNVKDKKCIVCKKKIPTFNIDGSSKAFYCGDCRTPEMIDVKNKKCIICKTTAYYGIPCNPPTHCSKHKQLEMINHPNRKCMSKTCNNTALYGLKSPIHCEIHRNDNDLLLVERICEKCGRLDVLVNNVCLNFCYSEEQFKYHKKQQKTKEIRILNLLKAEFGEPTEYNKRIPLNCGDKNSEEKEIVYDCTTHHIHIEVDEKQHKSYCTKGEFNRMKNIYHASGGIPIIFIRYNPDNFLGENKKRQKTSQKEREKNLIGWVKKYMSEEPKNPLAVKYLYYDEETYGSNLYTIDPYEHGDFGCDKCNREFFCRDILDKHCC